jgi:hypothetical protein
MGPAYAQRNQPQFDSSADNLPPLMAWSRRQSGSEFGEFDAYPLGLVTIKGCDLTPAETAPTNAAQTPDVYS